MKILFSPTARRQFLEALGHICRDNPTAARQLRLKVEHALARLKDQPDSGRHLPEFPGLPYREVIVSPYRFFYRVKDQTIWIVAVWHGAQLPHRPAK